MSQLANFSDLQSLSAFSPNYQLFLRLDNGLSGVAGFGRTTFDVFEKGMTIFSSVSPNSASWNASLTLTANFQASFTSVVSNSAKWTALYAASANWNSVYTTFNANSALWSDSRSTVNANSALWSASQTEVNTHSANWNSTYTTTDTKSANWDSNYNTVLNTSAFWNNVIDKTVSACNVMDFTMTISSSAFDISANMAGRTAICDAADGSWVYVPRDSDLFVPTDSRLTFIDFHGSNYIVFDKHPDVTINSFANSLSSAGRGAECSLLKVSPDTWFLLGKLA